MIRGTEGQKGHAKVLSQGKHRNALTIYITFRWRGPNRQAEPGPTNFAGKANIGHVGYKEQGCKDVQGKEDKVSAVDPCICALRFPNQASRFPFQELYALLRTFSKAVYSKLINKLNKDKTSATRMVRMSGSHG